PTTASRPQAEAPPEPKPEPKPQVAVGPQPERPAEPARAPMAPGGPFGRKFGVGTALAALVLVVLGWRIIVSHVPGPVTTPTPSGYSTPRALQTAAARATPITGRSPLPVANLPPLDRAVPWGTWTSTISHLPMVASRVGCDDLGGIHLQRYEAANSGDLPVAFMYTVTNSHSSAPVEPYGLYLPAHSRAEGATIPFAGPCPRTVQPWVSYQSVGVTVATFKRFVQRYVTRTGNFSVAPVSNDPRTWDEWVALKNDGATTTLRFSASCSAVGKERRLAVRFRNSGDRAAALIFGFNATAKDYPEPLEHAVLLPAHEIVYGPTISMPGNCSQPYQIWRWIYFA
ncbi:MAG: hypothetical protein ACREM2_08605, partial [Vulcanimicrobiaceae bacterium]